MRIYLILVNHRTEYKRKDFMKVLIWVLNYLVNFNVSNVEGKMA
jgi:hypothetical protein